MRTFILLGIGGLLGSSSATAQLVVQPTSDPSLLAASLAAPPAELEIDIDSARYIGDPEKLAAGTFAGAAALGLPSGIVFTTGCAADAAKLNSTLFDSACVEPEPGEPAPVINEASTAHLRDGDRDLENLHPDLLTGDASGLVFQFNSSARLVLRYVFASEEHPDPLYGDAVGIFLDGRNLAVVPGTVDPDTTDPVSALTINRVKNEDLFRRNEAGQVAFVYDGLTRVLRVVTQIAPGLHTLKLVVADTGDFFVDSAVFVQVPEPSDNLLKTVGLGACVLVARGFRRC